MSHSARHRSTRGSALNDTTSTVVGMAVLWVIPVAALLLTLTRL